MCSPSSADRSTTAVPPPRARRNPERSQRWGLRPPLSKDSFAVQPFGQSFRKMVHSLSSTGVALAKGVQTAASAATGRVDSDHRTEPVTLPAQRTRKTQDGSPEDERADRSFSPGAARRTEGSWSMRLPRQGHQQMQPRSSRRAEASRVSSPGTSVPVSSAVATSRRVGEARPASSFCWSFLCSLSRVSPVP